MVLCVVLHGFLLKIENPKKKGETCHDRMVRQSEKYAENALEGKKDIKVPYI